MRIIEIDFRLYGASHYLILYTGGRIIWELISGSGSISHSNIAINNTFLFTYSLFWVLKIKINIIEKN